MLQFLVDAPGHTDQGWWCRALQWFCDGADLSRHAPIAPEITDADILTLALVFVILGGLWIGGRR